MSEDKPPEFRFDPIDKVQMQLLAQLRPGQRIQATLDARELVAGMIRGRLRRLHPDASERELNMMVLEELSREPPRAP